MDVLNILQKVSILNQNSLVKKSSQTTPLVERIIDHINLGKMIYDSTRGVEKPDPNWNKATLLLQRCVDTFSQDIFRTILEDIQRFSKPHKLEPFTKEWKKWLQRDKGIDLTPAAAKSASNIQNLLKLAAYIEKSADNIDFFKNKLVRLINNHIGHIIELIERGKADKAKEYLSIIRPLGWEDNAERTVDKLYEQVVRGLAEKLEPTDFQALGL